MKCVHCSKTIAQTAEVFTYPLSRARAHVECVSVVSVNAVDQLLLARKEAPTRRVYSTGLSRRANA